jgi:hypothetical protein
MGGNLEASCGMVINCLHLPALLFSTEESLLTSFHLSKVIGCGSHQTFCAMVVYSGVGQKILKDGPPFRVAFRYSIPTLPLLLFSLLGYSFRSFRRGASEGRVTC